MFGTAEDFAKAFEAAFAYEAPYQAAQSAAAVHVFADAIKRAQSLDPEKVRDAIAATELDTFYGPIKFDEAGPQRRQAHGADPGPGRQICGGLSPQIGRRHAGRPAPAALGAAANYRLSPA